MGTPCGNLSLESPSADLVGVTRIDGPSRTGRSAVLDGFRGAPYFATARNYVFVGPQVMRTWRVGAQRVGLRTSPTDTSVRTISMLLTPLRGQRLHAPDAGELIPAIRLESL